MPWKWGDALIPGCEFLYTFSVLLERKFKGSGLLLCTLASGLPPRAGLFFLLLIRLSYCFLFWFISLPIFYWFSILCLSFSIFWIKWPSFGDLNKRDFFPSCWSTLSVASFSSLFGDVNSLVVSTELYLGLRWFIFRAESVRWVLDVFTFGKTGVLLPSSRLVYPTIVCLLHWGLICLFDRIPAGITSWIQGCSELYRGVVSDGNKLGWDWDPPW